MSTTLLARPWTARIGQHREFIPVDPQKPSDIKKRMIDLLKYVKLHQEKPGEILDNKIKQFFHATFDAFELQVNFTKKDREEIGPLIEERIYDLDDYLLGIGDQFDCDKVPSTLRIRSGFQFMIDNFKDFPNGKKSETLEESFKYFCHSDAIEILDKSITRWKENPYGCEENITYTPEILSRPKGVPESHHWWC